MGRNAMERSEYVRGRSLSRSYTYTIIEDYGGVEDWRYEYCSTLWR